MVSDRQWKFEIRRIEINIRQSIATLATKILSRSLGMVGSVEVRDLSPLLRDGPVLDSPLLLGALPRLS